MTGVVQTRRARQTGTLVTVQRADDGYGWETICEEHSTVCVHHTQRLAIYFSASPRDWCEACAAEWKTCTECGHLVRENEDRDWVDDRGETLCPASDSGRGPVAFHNVQEEER